MVPDDHIDLAEVPPAQRHALILRTFDALPTGSALDLVVSHDPAPLYFEFDRTRAGQFDWLYVEAGPGQWHVRISRVADVAAAAGTAGCGKAAGGFCACQGKPDT